MGARVPEMVEIDMTRRCDAQPRIVKVPRHASVMQMRVPDPKRALPYRPMDGRAPLPSEVAPK